MMTPQTDEALTLAAAYRSMEKASYADGVECRMRAALAADPDYNRAVRAEWKAIEEDILDRFRAMTPKDGKGGPKVYEVHHEIAVGKECYLIRLDAADSPADAAGFTRRRLGLVGDHRAFLAEQMARSQAETPSPF